jgi:hypothetical protein
VQAYIGHSDDGSLRDPFTIDLQEIEKGAAPGQFTFKGTIKATESGSYGFNVRVIPTHPYLNQEHELRLITWAK